MNHLKVRNQPTKVMVDNPLPFVLEATEKIDRIVGATLGPGGKPVLLERQEYGLPPFLTKDGVSVYKSLGFEGAIHDLVMEALRDPAVHTANEAGDGTTTATILAAAFIRRVHQFSLANPGCSPQGVGRALQAMLSSALNFLQEKSVAAVMRGPDGQLNRDGLALLKSVARTSANGDEQIAASALEAMVQAGDAGNVVLTEAPGEGYLVEKIEGYSLAGGWEDTAKTLAPNWWTDQAREICRVDAPRVLVYNGKLSSLSPIAALLERVIAQCEANQSDDEAAILAFGAEAGVIGPCQHKTADKVCGATMSAPAEGKWRCEKGHAAVLDPALDECRRLSNVVVVVANSFSESVLTDFFMNFRKPDGLKLVPCLAPHGPSPNYQVQILQDIAAITGSTIIDPISARLSDLSCLGPGIAAFEMDRLRSNFEGAAYKMAALRASPYRTKLAQRMVEVRDQVSKNVSVLDRTYSQERLAKLSGGLIRLIVRGTSNADIRERRDRAEDAICAIRGATREGCLPGAGWGLFALASHLRSHAAAADQAMIEQIMVPALTEPFRRLLSNAGYSAADVEVLWVEMARRVEEALGGAPPSILDVTTREWVDPFAAGILDSTPAVDRAVRSASAQIQMGYLGGIVAYKRDSDLERSEALAASAYQRAVAQGANEANDRS